MKFKIIFAIIFLCLPLLLAQTQDSLRTFLFKTSFIELTFKYPDSLDIYGVGNTISLIWEEGGPKYYKTFLRAEKTIYIDIIISQDDFFQTAKSQNFVLLDDIWFDVSQLKKIKRNNQSENIAIEDWKGIKVIAEWDESVLFTNEFIQKGYRYLLSKKFGDRSIYISADQRNAPDIENILTTIFKSISLTVEQSLFNKRSVYKNIRGVDFFNMEYTLYEGEELPDYEKTKVTVKDGEYFEELYKGGKSSRLYYFKVYGLEFGDLTGDGEEDAVLRSGENDGGTGWDENVYVYSLVNGKPKQILLYEGGDRADDGIDKVEIKKGILYISQLEGYLTPCCADFVYTTGYKWNGQKFVQKSCEEFEHTSRIIKDTLYCTELIKGVSVVDSVEYFESFLVELKKGKTLFAEGTNFNPKYDVYVVLTDFKGKVLNKCRDIKTQKINFKVPADGYYYLRISPEPTLGGKRRFKLTMKLD